MNIQDLNGIRSSMPVNLFPTTGSTQAACLGAQRTNSVQVDLSLAGKLMDRISGMSEEARAEIQEFRREMESAIQSGTFDAAEMAKNAPEALKTLAEENDIDLGENA